MTELALIIAGLATSVAIGVPTVNLLMRGFISFHKSKVKA